MSKPPDKTKRETSQNEKHVVAQLLFEHSQREQDPEVRCALIEQLAGPNPTSVLSPYTAQEIYNGLGTHPFKVGTSSRHDALDDALDAYITAHARIYGRIENGYGKKAITDIISYSKTVTRRVCWEILKDHNPREAIIIEEFKNLCNQPGQQFWVTDEEIGLNQPQSAHNIVARFMYRLGRPKDNRNPLDLLKSDIKTALDQIDHQRGYDYHSDRLAGCDIADQMVFFVARLLNWCGGSAPRNDVKLACKAYFKVDHEPLTDYHVETVAAKISVEKEVMASVQHEHRRQRFLTSGRQQDMPARERQLAVLEMFALQDFSHGEIAKALSITVENSKRILSSAKAHMAHVIEEENIEREMVGSLSKEHGNEKRG